MGSVFTEASIAWILLLGTGCLLYYPKRVSALSEDDFIFDDEENKQHLLPRVKPRNSNPDVMTCNCSWGTVLYRTKPKTRKLDRRSTAGRPINKKEHYPMMAGIQVETSCTVCAATILTEYHALTTAECVRDYTDLTLAVGVHDRCKQPNDGGQYIPVEASYAHEDFVPASKENDIAIVVTKQNIAFSKNVGPACIHTEQICNEEDPILVLGWGKLTGDDTASTSLMKLFVKAVEPKSCEKELGADIYPNLHLRLCTTAYKMGGCAGDSGSPLFMVDHSINRIVLVGIMSSGTRCGRSDLPATNVALHPYLGWIQWTIEKSLKEHHPTEYKRCDSSFCYITNPKLN